MARSGRHRRGTGTGGKPPSTPSTPSTPWPPPTPPPAASLRPRGPGPLPAEVDPLAFPEPDLVVDVRHLLRVGGPLDLLATVSSMLSIVDPRTVYPYDHLRPPTGSRGAADELELDTIVQSFLEVDVPESSALLAALAQLAPDPSVRARARAEVVRRGDALPPWVTGLAHARPYRAVLVSHVRGMADNVILGVRLPPRHEITVSVYIDHDEGTVVTDCVALPAQLTDVVVTLQSVIAELGTWFDDIDLVDARDRITRAVDNGAAAYPPAETEDWPLFRPLVEWVVRLVPTEHDTGDDSGCDAGDVPGEVGDG